MGKDLKGKELGAGISQRKDGRYDARYTDRFGKRRSIYSKSLPELREMMNTVLYENSRKLNVNADNLTLDSYFELWIGIKQSDGVRRTTIEGYRGTYKRYVKPRLAHRKLNDITTLEVRGLIQDLQERGVSGATRRLVRSLLSGIFKQAAYDDLVVKNPVNAVKINKVEKKTVRVLSREEYAHFFACSSESFYANLFVVAVESGLRPGELFALTVEDLDFKKQSIRVNKTLTRLDKGDDNGRVRIGPPKTESGNRVVPMTRRCEEALKKQLNQREYSLRDGRQLPKEFGNLMFMTSVGHPLSTKVYTHAIKKVIHEVELQSGYHIEPFTGHCFRHTFATRCFEAGIQPKTVQAYLGHATLQMTMNLYVHVTESYGKEEIKKLEQLA